MKENIRKAIVVGIDHHNTLGAIRSLGECGIKSDLVLEVQSKYSFISKSKYIRKCISLINGSLVDTLLITYKSEKEKPIIICTTDTSIDIIDQHYNELNKYFICPNAGNQGNIHKLMNKDYTIEIAKRCGLITPSSICLSRDSNIPKLMFYPCYVKTIDSICGSKADSRLCCDEKDLRLALKKNINYQVQEYIDKDTELLINGVSLNKGKVSYFPLVIEKIRQYPKGVGACTYCKVENIEKYPYINIFAIKKFLEEIKYEGIFSIEFIVKNNKAYFLEINLRNDGTAYIPTVVGFKLHYLWYCYAVGTSITKLTIDNDVPFFFSSDVNDIRHVLERRLSFLKWFTDTLRARTYLLFNKHDIKPWLFFYINIIRRKFIK